MLRPVFRGQFASMPADSSPLVPPIRRQLKDLEERLASLRGYL